MRLNKEAILSRIHELEHALSEVEAVFDAAKFKKTSQEHSYLQGIWSAYLELESVQKAMVDGRLLLKEEKDAEFQQLIQDDLEALQARQLDLEKKISALLIPPDENDSKTTLIEIRAGAGGQEAMLFVADCLRMYMMYASRMGWRSELLSATPSDLGGLKECVAAFSGENVWRYLQHEAGTHRVQRVPETEAQGRIHTSTITVAALLESEDESDNIQISDQDVRMEATRSSGAGGQHVNKTDSAVRLTHIPSGIVVFCQEERSQHKNRDKAFRLLRAKLVDLERRRYKDEIDQLRSEQVGTGDRSEKIRTYNFPQSRVTDHRVGLTKHNLSQVLGGELEEFSQALVAHATKEAKTESLYSWMILHDA